MVGQERLREFGAFLRARRERLQPGMVGLPEGSRRRTPGLRREEVAQLADVSTTWYTWLEQGRGLRPSRSVVEALARALRLGDAELHHLLILSGHLDERAVASPPGATAVPPAVQAVLDGLGPIPAHVVNLRYDVLAWNAAQASLITDYAQRPAHERNVLWLLFHDQVFRSRILNWEADADAMVAQFRTIIAAHAGRADLTELVDRLCSSSTEFADRWGRREVLAPMLRVKHCIHPGTGRIDLEVVASELVGLPESRLIVFAPADDISAARLPGLVAAGPAPRIAHAV